MQFGDGYHFLFHGSKGQILLKSTPYNSVDDCIDGIPLSKKYGTSDENYLGMIEKDKYYYFLLQDDDGEEIASGKKTPSMHKPDKLTEL